MKNAFVLQHHYGDDGNVTEGMILRDVTSKRFDELEKSGLVREATAEEVEKGHRPKIEADESAAGGKQAKSPPNKGAPKSPNKGGKLDDISQLGTWKRERLLELAAAKEITTVKGDDDADVAIADATDAQIAAAIQAKLQEA